MGTNDVFPGAPGDTIIQGIVAAVLEGEAEPVVAAVTDALAAGFDPEVILNEGLTAAMATVGEMLDRGELYIPDVLWSAEAMQAGLALLLPHLAEGVGRSAGSVVVGTVQGDVHDIGKNFVGLMLSGAGFAVRDLGHDVSADAFADAVAADGAQFLGMSAMLTTTMPVMAKTLELLEARGLRSGVRVLVGGAPVTQAYADKIGADGWAIDASRAVAVAKELA
jgi:5-methyltetrahydrofolate--homocysteine methyltransferase